MKLPEPEESGEDTTGPALVFFGIGLVAYLSGFWLLAHDHPDAAPFVIVAGLLSMLWGFLL